ncbi:pentapeptide repeat-containing protein [Scytonema sp. NUACC26]|uniref:pentapeptide repeat-containing protein n=1 Tax=Scytonema sp. NUACC26 TaxID=3140176 RepID=UPI0034DC88BA
MNVEEFLDKYTSGTRDFYGVDLCEANLSGAKLNGVNLSKADLSVINLSGANLSEANLSYAKLNVAKLRGANLKNANLKGATLNVANLIRADLSNAQLTGASMIRCELIRANLSHADLMTANLKGADLREAALRHTVLREAHLSEATFKDSFLTGANLELANLKGADLTRADLSGANFRDAELKQAILIQADLSGANLSGANLRWADLSRANLRWADLSEAKLSGANLTGADLSYANLTNASLIHTDLTHAKLIKVEWVGADLTGAVLTGTKLYATSRFGLKTEGIICEWVDLSPTGDRTIIHNFTSLDSRDFFNETPPTIRIIVDKTIDHEANFAIAGAYYQIAQQYPELKQPPSIEVGCRRTIFTFYVDNDESLLPTAYIAILPFKDTSNAHKNIYTLIEMISDEDTSQLGLRFHSLEKVNMLLEQAIDNAALIKKMKKILEITGKFKFFQAPTQIVLTNSSAQNLLLYDHPYFGKRFLNSADDLHYIAYDNSMEVSQIITPSLSMIVDFFKGFHLTSDQ